MRPARLGRRSAEQAVGAGDRTPRGGQPFAHEAAAESGGGFHSGDEMALALGLKKAGDLGGLIAEGSVRFFGQNEPVVPVADFVLEFFEGLADLARLEVVVRGEFGDVAGLLGPLAEFMKVAGVEELHLGSQAGEAVEGDDTRGFPVNAAWAARAQSVVEVIEAPVEFFDEAAGLGAKVVRQFRATMAQPRIEVIGLLLKG